MRDFAGRDLCENCWNGIHWRHDPLTKELGNNCLKWADRVTRCMCECKYVQDYKRFEKERSAELRRRDKRAQLELL